jgi:hypothetical protein
MDKQSERTVVMVKKVLYIFVCAVHSVSASVTNIEQIINVPLSYEVVTNIEKTVYRTPHTAYLSFVRAVSLADAKELVSGFLPSKIKQITGTYNANDLSNEQCAILNEIIGGNQITNMMLTSFSESNLKDWVKISGKIKTFEKGGREFVCTYPITFVNTNNAWLIEKFMDEQ